MRLRYRRRRKRRRKRSRANTPEKEEEGESPPFSSLHPCIHLASHFCGWRREERGGGRRKLFFFGVCVYVLSGAYLNSGQVALLEEPMQEFQYGAVWRYRFLCTMCHANESVSLL